MIKDLKIENFKGFKSFEISDFKQVNLITGKNNSGKSSLLEAINILYKPTDAYYINSVQNDNFEKSSCISFFYKLNDINSIKISANKGEQSLIITLTTINDIKQEPRFIFDYNDKNGHTNYPVDKRNSADRWQPHFSVKLINTNLIKISECASLYDDIQNNKYENQIISILNETINHNLKEIKMGLNNSLKVDVGYDQLIPFSALGDGMKALFKILLAMYTTKDGIILIDEVENGFHYSVLPNVWKVILKAAKEFNVQVFATTHSLECIKAYYDAFKELNLPDDFINYYRLVKKDEEETINYKQYTPAELEAAFEMNLEVRGA